MQNFKDYIEILKILRNVRTKNKKFLKKVWYAFLSFVKNASLFKNSEELFVVDELHVNLFQLEEDLSNIDYYKEAK